MLLLEEEALNNLFKSLIVKKGEGNNPHLFYAYESFYNISSVYFP